MSMQLLFPLAAEGFPWGDVLLAAVVGGVVIFFWNFIAWMVLPHHQKEFKKVDDPSDLEAALSKAGVEHAFYCVPHHESFPEGMKDKGWLERLEAGPNAMILAYPKGNPMSGATMGKGLVLNIVQAFGLAMLLAYAGGALDGTLDVLLFGAGLGALISLTAHMAQVIWMQFPLSYALNSLFDYVVGFGLAAFVISLL